MNYHKLGSSDLNVSDICLGTMTWGEQNTEAEAHAQLDLAFERGVNFIDTAELYPVPAKAETQGLTESYLGTWLKNQKRENVIVATKVVGKTSMDWFHGDTSFSRENIRAAIEDSLKRLQTDYVDLYQLHWPDRYAPIFGGLHYNPKNYQPGTPFEEIVQTLAELIKEGKIRHWGVSNENPYGVGQYVQTAQKLGAPGPISIQNAYNLLNRIYEISLAETCFHENVELLAYSVLGFGFLTGKYRNGAQPDGARVSLFPGFAKRYRKQTGENTYQLKPNAAEAIEAYAELAGKDELASMALQFVKGRPFAKTIIVGATSPQQLAQNLDALEGDLSDKTLKQIEAIHSQYPNPCP